MSHAMTASLKPSFRAPWKMGTPWSAEEKWCMDNIREWTFLVLPELLTAAFCRNDWKRISAESSLVSPDDHIGQETKLK